MTAFQDLTPQSQPAIFVLSADGRESLAKATRALGWRPIAARRAEGAAARYRAASADVVLLDMRAMKDDETLAELGAAVRVRGGALIALVEDGEAGASLLAAGATHIARAGTLSEALASAHIMVQRLRSARGATDAVGPTTALAQDAVTGLADRAALIAWLEARLPSVTLIMLSIGRLDSINNAYGRVTGDTLLGHIGERLSKQLSRRDALLARTGGADFLVALADGDAPAVAQALVDAVGQPFAMGDHQIRLAARCGLAEAYEGDDPARLIRRAGAALADARGAGRNIVVHSAARPDHHRLEADLRHALQRDEIEILFQPQYDVADDHIVGVEALARWNHPALGPIGAGLLFDIAERADFLLPLSAHVQARAVAQAAAWPRSLAHLRLAVNVTAADIGQAGFASGFLSLLDRAGLDAHRVTVEITESGMMSGVDKAGARLGGLREAGVAIAIDDFGTGYSSLAYLKDLPVDYLKIDSGLAGDICGSARDRVIVRGVIAMAKSLGLKVVTEGVETEEQLALLAAEGVRIYQGFLRAPAVGSPKLIELVAR